MTEDASTGTEQAVATTEQAVATTEQAVATTEQAVATGGSSLDREGDAAADYVEALLDIVDLDGDIDIGVEGERASVSVVGDGLSRLVGPNGEVLDALQDLTRLAAQQRTGLRSRLMLDIGGYRARRRRELADLGRQIAEEVKRSGSPKRLEPMTPFERKIIHDAVASMAGVVSESEGEDPDRRVVVRPD
ncbi:MAG: Jag family protein [Mycobacteriales bacterium]